MRLGGVLVMIVGLFFVHVANRTRPCAPLYFMSSLKTSCSVQCCFKKIEFNIASRLSVAFSVIG